MSTKSLALVDSADVSEAVCDFYDRYPYPPPVENLDKYQRHWYDPQRRRAAFHLFWPHESYREEQSILIAGCGTSQAAKHAMRWPAAQVTAIDVSATSVNRTEQLKKRHNLQNLAVHRLALERVEDLGMTFDHIVCTGVLHHLEDPDTGLRALRDVLKPTGAIEIMVYAPYGRTGIYMLQEFCRRVAIRPLEGDIPDLVEVLRSLPGEHPLQKLLTHAPDFQNQAALADALLHPRDRAFSVPQLFDFLERGGLTFGRWVRQAPYCIHCGAAANIPQGNRIQRLIPADQYAVVELFRGTMVRHSFVAYRNDPEASHRGIDFSRDAWLGYIPIRLAETVCVQDRLPSGVAAVLINTGHTYKDLLLTVNSKEKAWLDAIDGVRSIGEIVEKSLQRTPETDVLDAARALFERLWWYDQVVFDASRATAA